MKTSPAIAQYLERYAEPSPELDRVAAFGPFEEVVVVPSCGEDAILDGLLESLVAAAEENHGRTLVLLVVNQTESTALEYQQANRAVLDRLPALSRISDQTILAVLDRTADSREGGVGWARKTGADFALRLHARGLVASPWIHTTDADARVALDYFELTPPSGGPWGLGPLPQGAVVHPFFHELEGEMGEALEQYDRFLKYYSQGLSYAGSPFAYPTIGSTLSFSPEAYAQVRGFPKRDAGEDFYFLHKIAKVGLIWPGGGEVRLVCRASRRVPFGTGQSIAKIQQMELDGETYRVYHPQIFQQLRQWLAAIDALSEGVEWEKACEGFSSALRETLAKLGAEAEDALIRKSRKGFENKSRHWHTWFDGFKTLKLIHLLRDAQYPNVPLEEASLPGVLLSSEPATFSPPPPM